MTPAAEPLGDVYRNDNYCQGAVVTAPALLQRSRTLCWGREWAIVMALGDQGGRHCEPAIRASEYLSIIVMPGVHASCMAA